MSSRARRITRQATIERFPWQEEPAGPAAQPDAEIPPPPTPDEADAAPDMAEHKARLAALEREAFAKGYEQGERAGSEAAAQRGEAILRRLTQTVEELTMLRAQMIHQTERQMVQLALAVARRIVHREVSLDQDLLIAMARVALDRLGESAQVTIRLNPEEYEATGAARVAQLTAANVTVLPDARVQRGGCRVESNLGALDAGVDAQLQEIAYALLGDEEPATADVVVK
jgi:flagellar assembly protein FliH